MSIKRISQGPAMSHRQAPAMLKRPAQQAAGFTGKDFLRILRKRLLLICIILGLFIALSVGGTYLWRLYWPGYETSAMIEVNMSKNRDPFTIGGGQVSTVIGREERLNTVASQITTYAILQSAAQRDDINGSAWARMIKDSDKNIVDELQKSIQAIPHPKSFHVMIRMKVNGRNYKDDVAGIVNAVATEFVEHGKLMQNNRITLQHQLLNNQLQDEKNIRRGLDSSLADKRSSAKSSGVDGVVIRSKIQILQSRKFTVQSEYDAAKKSYEQSEASYKAGTLGDSPIVQQIVNNALLRFQGNADEFERRYLSVTKRFPPNHRQCIAAKAEWEVALSQLNEERQKQTPIAIETVLSTQKMNRDTSAEELGQLQESLEEATTKLSKWTEEQGAIEVLLRKIRITDDRIARVTKDIQPFEILARGSDGVRPPLSIADRAKTPKLISSPKWSIMIPLGVVLGLLSSIGLAMLLEFADSSVKTPRDLTRRLNLPLLGIIPHIDDVVENVGDVRLACLTNPASLIAESFHQIRTNILYSEDRDSKHCLLITSPSPSDGRTTVSVNLAATLASGGKTVLLIDANFRQPSVQGLFNQCPQGGLSGALVGDGNWRDLVCEVEHGLFVMASGAMPHNPSELLHSGQMTQMLDEMKSMYDYVIIDAPPVLVVSDASVLATLVDGVILAVRAGSNTHGVVQRAKETLTHVRAKFIGVILNGLRTTAGGYLQKNYNTFYQYGQNARLPAPAPAPMPEPIDPKEEPEEELEVPVGPEA